MLGCWQQRKKSRGRHIWKDHCWLEEGQLSNWKYEWQYKYIWKDSQLEGADVWFCPIAATDLWLPLLSADTTDCPHGRHGCALRIEKDSKPRLMNPCRCSLARQPGCWAITWRQNQVTRWNFKTKYNRCLERWNDMGGLQVNFLYKLVSKWRCWTTRRSRWSFILFISNLSTSDILTITIYKGACATVRVGRT